VSGEGLDKDVAGSTAPGRAGAAGEDEEGVEVGKKGRRRKGLRVGEGRNRMERRLPRSGVGRNLDLSK
jgi:hypothetical protein